MAWLRGRPFGLQALYLDDNQHRYKVFIAAVGRTGIYIALVGLLASISLGESSRVLLYPVAHGTL